MSTPAVCLLLFCGGESEALLSEVAVGRTQPPPPPPPPPLLEPAWWRPLLMRNRACFGSSLLLATGFLRQQSHGPVLPWSPSAAALAGASSCLSSG